MPFQTPQPPITIEGAKPFAVAGGIVAYENGVVVRYGMTRLSADRLTYFPEESRGIAEGHVVLVDPAGTAYADRIEFDGAVGRNTGRGTNVSVRIANGLLKAGRVEFAPGEWNLYDVEGTTCLEPRPVYYVTSDHVTITPGKQARIHHPKLSILGKYVAQLPNQTASFIAAVPGIGYPSPRYKLGRGVGLTWNGGLLVGRQSTFNFNANAYSKRPINGLAQYTYSFLPLDKATEVVAPRNDFSERYSFGFLNSIRSDSPADEAAYLRARRSSLSVDAQLRGSIADRNRGRKYNRVETVYESGGSAGSVGYLAQARLQGIQPVDGDLAPRLKLVGSAGLPNVELGRGLQLLTRFDGEGFLGKTGYGWLQATSGVSYRATKALRLSAGGFASSDFGTPQFGMDPLFAEQGFLLRSDLRLGGLTFSYLVKHDPGGRGTYDHEFALRQVVGCFELFFSKREYPYSRNLGITLRVQPFTDALKRRVAQVTKGPNPVPAERSVP